MTRLSKSIVPPYKKSFFFLLAFIIASGKTNPLLSSPAIVYSSLRQERKQSRPAIPCSLLSPPTPPSGHRKFKGIQAASEGHFRFVGVPLSAPLVEEYGPRAYPSSVGGPPSGIRVHLRCRRRISAHARWPVAPHGASLRVPATSTLHASPPARLQMK
jgi:hypothetical protein